MHASVGCFPVQLCVQQGRCAQGHSQNIVFPPHHCCLILPTQLSCGQAEGGPFLACWYGETGFPKYDSWSFSGVASCWLFPCKTAHSCLLAKALLLLSNMAFFPQSCIFVPSKCQKYLKYRLLSTLALGTADKYVRRFENIPLVQTQPMPVAGHRSFLPFTLLQKHQFIYKLCINMNTTCTDTGFPFLHRPRTYFHKHT